MGFFGDPYKPATEAQIERAAKYGIDATNLSQLETIRRISIAMRKEAERLIAELDISPGRFFTYKGERCEAVFVKSWENSVNIDGHHDLKRVKIKLSSGKVKWVTPTVLSLPPLP